MNFKGIHLDSLVNLTIPYYVSCCVFSRAVACLGTIWGDPRYKVCPESKDTKVLNMYNIFNLQKRHCE